MLSLNIDFIVLEVKQYRKTIVLFGQKYKISHIEILRIYLVAYSLLQVSFFIRGEYVQKNLCLFGISISTHVWSSLISDYYDTRMRINWTSDRENFKPQDIKKILLWFFIITSLKSIMNFFYCMPYDFFKFNLHIYSVFVNEWSASNVYKYMYLTFNYMLI